MTDGWKAARRAFGEAMMSLAQRAAKRDMAGQAEARAEVEAAIRSLTADEAAVREILATYDGAVAQWAAIERAKAVLRQFEVANDEDNVTARRLKVED